MCITAGSWTSLFPRSIRDRLFAEGSPQSTAGSPIQAGSLFASAARKTESFIPSTVNNVLAEALPR